KGGKVEAMVRASASGKHSQKKPNCLARQARRRPAQNLPRHTRLSTFTGRKKLDREEIQRAWSADRPPLGTTQSIWGGRRRSAPKPGDDQPNPGAQGHRR